MALPQPNLDDRTYAQLVQEAIARIPIECPEWTDHNPSDTGIILIELLAWLTEMTLYQVNQIPNRNIASFLSLLKGENWQLPGGTADQQQVYLEQEIRSTLHQLRQPYRAITPQDFEHLILEEWNNQKKDDDLKIDRVKVLPQYNLDANSDGRQPAPGHISLVVTRKTERKYPDTDLKDALMEFLKPRLLLTTRLHIRAYEPIQVKLKKATLVLTDGADPKFTKENVNKVLNKFFNPRTDPKNPYWGGRGWPFGRSVYLSELYKLLDDLPTVDYVEEDLELEGQEQKKIPLQEYQLVKWVDTDFKENHANPDNKLRLEVNSGS